MHRTFQAELTKMRLSTARAFVKITGAAGLGRGASTGMVSASNQSVRINARLMGFGPQFRIIVDIQNTGTKTMIQTPIVTMYNANIYSVPRALQIVRLIFYFMISSISQKFNCY
jgi:Bardet-Biedl syndrome 1 protein